MAQLVVVYLFWISILSASNQVALQSCQNKLVKISVQESMGNKCWWSSKDSLVSRARIANHAIGCQSTYIHKH